MTEKQSASLPGGKSLLSAGGLIIFLIILVLVNVIFSKVNLRWDSTAEKLYSLSEGTRQILSELPQETVLKIFYTKDSSNMPVHIKNYSKRVLDFISEYERYGNGNVIVENYNPKPDSEEEEWAVKYGLKGANLPTGEKIYLGLVATAADQEAVIPMFDPAREQQLEYDITQLITRVQSAQQKRIGIISALPVMGGPSMNMMQGGGMQQPWLFVTELKKDYDVQNIPATGETIEGDFDLLMLIHPKNLGDGLQYAVDQHVLKGGKLLVFADPFCVSDAVQRGQSNASDSLDALFKSWGVEMDMAKVVLDFNYATRLRGQNNQVENNPMWLSFQPEAFNKDAIITAQLDGMLMPVAGALKKSADSPYKYESLVQSSANSSLGDAFMARFGGGEALRRNFKATVEQYDMAVQLTGKFKTAFPGGKPKADDGKEEAAPGAEDKKSHLAEGEKEATIVIVSDADLLFDNYYVQKQNFLGFNISQMFNDNLVFLLNGGEMLTGSEALISIRSRGKFERPFTKVQELEKKAQARWLSREQELMREVDETNRKLRQLDQNKDASQKMLVSAAQEAEIQKFQEKKIQINKELKKVRRNLRADIESLGNTIKFLNIFLMVFVVSGIGIGYGLYRRKKSRR